MEKINLKMRVKYFVIGMKLGFNKMVKLIRNESKWWIIPCIIDLVLIPLKLIFLLPIMIFAPSIMLDILTEEDVHNIMEEMLRED